MLRSAFPRTHSLLRLAHSQKRSFAEAVKTPIISSSNVPPPPVSAPRKRTIAVNPDHGLYAFFRKKVADDGNKVSYETLTSMADQESHTGRSWKASELRLKSFKDLHTLWYVLLREKNLLATQREEQRRLTGMTAFRPNRQLHQVSKSMARIKYVINERRLAYEGAVELVATQRTQAKEDKHDQEVLAYQMKVWNQERMKRGRKVAHVRKGRSVHHARKVAKRLEMKRAEERKAAAAAASGVNVGARKGEAKVVSDGAVVQGGQAQTQKAAAEVSEVKEASVKAPEERVAAGLFGSSKST